MTFSDTLSDVAASAGVGALAGLAGTAAMTASTSLESKLRSRDASAAPSEAAGAVLGVEPKDESGKARFNNAVHWAYGTAWGAVRGLLDAIGVHGVRAAALHLGAVWGGEQVVLPATGASSPAWKWEGKEVAIDLLHHGVYVAVTSAVYELLDPHRTRGLRGLRHGHLFRSSALPSGWVLGVAGSPGHDRN
jgi:hypothetical protein